MCATSDETTVDEPTGKKFPLEIWRLIFEQIHDDVASLASAARLCRTLQLEVEAVLYYTIQLTTYSQLQRLTEALKSSCRRANLVRGLKIDLHPHRWPSVQGPDAYMPRLTPEAVQEVNTLLRILVRLQMLEVWHKGLDGMNPGSAETMLEGCTFQLRTFKTCLELVKHASFFDVLATQPNIQELTVFPVIMKVRPSIVIPADILPKLRLLRATSFVVRGLRAPHSITHLSIAYEERCKLDSVLRILGPQLLSLSLCGRTILGNTLTPIIESDDVEMPHLTRLATCSRTEEEMTHIMRHKPLNLKTFHPLKVPIKTWVWCIRVEGPQQDKDHEAQKRYNVSVAWFAGKILRAWPTLETFVFVRLDSYYSMIYSLDANDQVVEREERSTRQMSWDMY